MIPQLLTKHWSHADQKVGIILNSWLQKLQRARNCASSARQSLRRCTHWPASQRTPPVSTAESQTSAGPSRPWPSSPTWSRTEPVDSQEDKASDSRVLPGAVLRHSSSLRAADTMMWWVNGCKTVQQVYNISFSYRFTGYSKEVEGWCLFACLFAWCLTALSAQIGYMVP